MFFTVEETNLMCCFDTSSRKRLIAEMKSLPINELDDEMAELLFHTVRKLEGITDEAFAQLYIDGRLKGGRLCPYWMAVLKPS
mgnify:CR=1 FL=1